MEIKLSKNEIEFLRCIKRQQGTGDPTMPCLPISSSIQSLIDRGYVRTKRLFLPVLNTWTEDIGLFLTEAGETVLTTIDK